LKRQIFIKAFEHYQEQLLRSLLRSNNDPDIAADVVQETICTLLANKTYQRLKFEAIDGRVYTHMRLAAKGVLSNIVRSQHRENQTFVSIKSAALSEHDNREDTDNIEYDRERIPLDTECPFCFRDELVTTAYNDKVCSYCHTIQGQGKYVRVRMSIDEADLLSLPELDRDFDVNNALLNLTPLEQIIIRAIANNTDTLDDLAVLHGVSRDNLWRVYVQAKRKLQTALAEYK